MAQIGLQYNFDYPPSYLDEAQWQRLGEASSSYHLQSFFEKNAQAKIGRVLLEASLEDRRVPPSQSVALYHLLKRHGQDVRFLTFPNNGHVASSHECQAAQIKAELEFLVEQLDLANSA